MTFPWNQDNPETRQHGTRSAAETNASDDLAMIPWWSVALAIVAFAGMQYIFFFYHPQHGPGPGPPQRAFGPMHYLMAYSWGTLVASYVLLVGYVSRDVKRRNMQAGLWMLMVLLMPGGIGAVVYFLLRQPILSRCPHCSTELAASYHFCPQCQFQMAPVCGQCFRGVEITDVYCKQCGHDLEKDQVPARLRAFRD
jgi:Double zinc ribbon